MREENVIKYYVLCNKLKNIIRTGWKDWNVQRDRLESVAEHVYSVQSLALAMYLEYGYDVDLAKVILMIAVHESEEIFIGDLTQFQISKEDKDLLGHKAVARLFKDFINSEIIENLIYEFDERKTKEAFFAYQCDKLDCDLMAKLYDEEGCVDLGNQEDNDTMNDERVRILLDSGMSFSEMWLSFGRNVYPYDDNFRDVSNYVMSHRISLK